MRESQNKSISISGYNTGYSKGIMYKHEFGSKSSREKFSYEPSSLVPHKAHKPVSATR